MLHSNLRPSFIFFCPQLCVDRLQLPFPLSFGFPFQLHGLFITFSLLPYAWLSFSLKLTLTPCFLFVMVKQSQMPFNYLTRKISLDVRKGEALVKIGSPVLDVGEVDPDVKNGRDDAIHRQCTFISKTPVPTTSWYWAVSYSNQTRRRILWGAHPNRFCCATHPPLCCSTSYLAPVTTAASVTETLQMLQKAFQGLPKGSVPETSGGTYLHIKAATNGMDLALEAATVTILTKWWSWSRQNALHHLYVVTVSQLKSSRSLCSILRTFRFIVLLEFSQQCS